MQIISTTADLAAVCERLAQHAYVAVDTEFIRETTFWPKLCLIQMAGPDVEVIVDPLAKGLDLQPFFDLMDNTAVTKVFHAARQDVEIVWVMGKTIPKPMFDSQVAAMVCGFGESISYVNLVKQITKADLDKSSRFTDWARRPLSPKQLQYALGDVTHLRDVYLQLKADLERTERASWLEEEMALLSDPRSYETQPEDSWRRVKMKVRGRKAQAVLIELAAWRERQAQAQDVPRNRVLRDEVLVDIATHMPTDVAALGELRSLSDGFARSARAKEIVEAVNAGLARDPKALPMQEQVLIVPPEKLAMVELLKVLLKGNAARHGVAPRLIADTSDIERIVMEPVPDVPAMRGWRREMFGADALMVREGQLAITVKNGQIVTVGLDDGLSD
jgi:ribonuclease D